MKTNVTGMQYLRTLFCVMRMRCFYSFLSSLGKPVSFWSAEIRMAFLLGDAFKYLQCP